MLNSAIRRVVGFSEIFSFAGTWLTRRGKRFTSLATVITLGAIVADTIGDSFFGFQLPVNKFGMATTPFLAAAVTFGLGWGLRYAAKFLSGADRTAAEANSVCEAREFKQTPQATNKQAEDLWERVGRYESILFNGSDKSASEEEEYLDQCKAKLKKAIDSLPDDCLKRYGIDPKERDYGIEKLIRHIEVGNPLSAGIESSKEGFVESVVYALNEAMPQLEQKLRIGFDLSQIETYRSWEIFQSMLAKEFKSNRFLRSAAKKSSLPYLSGIKCTAKGFADEMLRNLTRNKLYMLAGRGMNSLNARLRCHAFDAQPFLWMTDELKSQIIDHFGKHVLETIYSDRANIRKQIFWDDHRTRKHIFGCFDADFLRAFLLRLYLDVEYAAGMLRQKPKDDIDELSSLIGRKLVSDEVLSTQRDIALASMEESAKYIDGLDDYTVRAVRIANYAGHGRKTKKVPGKGDKSLVSQFTDEIVQVRVHEYLAREQIRAHCYLVESLESSEGDISTDHETELKRCELGSNA